MSVKATSKNGTRIHLNPQLALLFPLARTDGNGVSETKALWLTERLRNQLERKEKSEYGTFKDSLRAPVHRWFKYPAGYSYKFVEAKMKMAGITARHWVFDPFVGSGTTLVEAKRHNVNSIGIEAHPFVAWVAKVKTNWNIDPEEIVSAYNTIIQRARDLANLGDTLTREIPELVHKCYSNRNLVALTAIRDAIKECVRRPDVADFLNMALTDTLRNASKAATGWPYVSPSRIHAKVEEREAFPEFRVQVDRMLDDIQFMRMHYGMNHAKCNVLEGDARENHNEVRRGTVDLALTSPPYLNNYDYADRTRLETYFFGWYRSWGEITERVRDRLMMSATTQVRRAAFEDYSRLRHTMAELDKKLLFELQEKVQLMGERRKEKGGKKSYDCMVAGYFSDMVQVFKNVYDSLKTGACFVLVLGDSAPYGVHIPTDLYLARIGKAIGFSKSSLEVLRTRGDKWHNNPQRHKVKLREAILTLTK
ncbi:MAG: hypothetical protein FJ217_10785 [Ignavibacteria bacterium]|nr:hypothetical protein [Ignavibacteria bacterium]